MAADVSCTVVQPPVCELGPDPADAPLCGHSPEQFAEAALGLEPRGALWCKTFVTVKAALYRAFGKLLSEFEQRLCDLFKESLACESVELLSEWEVEYGLPGNCAPESYPTDLAGRQAQVCAARQASAIITLPQLQALLRRALPCEFLTLQATLTGVCVSGIGPAPVQGFVHNTVGGWGVIGTDGFGSGVGQPLTLADPDFAAPLQCPIVFHSTVGGWTGGVGIPLTLGDRQKYPLLVCLLQKHLPAHIAWRICI
ncbi:MAG TPA: hypothetical protein VE934_11950 [Polaromonas sp.]|uniref:hypothetical protein n=1 Tax=Polaromonas sp. TaxID=1869339 RepID=UPI002D45499C|nr:hypothetical protein [Polaromonas sp.]HYW57668.1 hypothetical protein [Polaromonas sp.]